jgi:hypothetical protein
MQSSANGSVLPRNSEVLSLCWGWGAHQRTLFFRLNHTLIHVNHYRRDIFDVNQLEKDYSGYCHPRPVAAAEPAENKNRSGIGLMLVSRAPACAEHRFRITGDSTCRLMRPTTTR